jgi:cephalosporin hydroxylase
VRRNRLPLTCPGVYCSYATQNPFDLMAIQDIIYTVKPDLIIETGRAGWQTC